jgi:epoxide hydrolase-like predicted phosphatase
MRRRVAIEAVLFDFGGVFTASPFRAITVYAESQGADPAHLMEVVFGPYDADTDHPWHRLERGETTMAQAFSEISDSASAAGLQFDAGELFGHMSGDPYDRTVVVEFVRATRARGVRTAVVTNNVREYGSAWRGMIPVEELFDVVIDSSELGIRKPNPAIYVTTLDRLGVAEPSRAVFLDDYAGNVAAARAVGLHGIVVGPDPQPALDELAALLEDE